MKQAAAEANNGVGGTGICPKCLLLPVKAGAEALDRTDDLAQAWLFAADAGASVIVSVTADLGYSTFMRQAVESIWRRGVVMVEASNDFNSTDHQGGMWWPHVLPGNGIVANGQGAPPPGEQASTTTFRERSNYTSWGTHNMFSVATDGGTTSESTPTVGAVAALLLAYGKDAADQHLIGSPLTNAEAIQVLRATASDIDDPSLGWPGKPGWDLQYGYGRPNVWKATRAVAGARSDARSPSITTHRGRPAFPSASVGAERASPRSSTCRAPADWPSCSATPTDGCTPSTRNRARSCRDGPSTPIRPW